MRLSNRIGLTEREDGVVIFTVEPYYMPWHGKFETAVSIDSKPLRIAEEYETLEEAMEGHIRFSKMSKEELINYKYMY